MCLECHSKLSDEQVIRMWEAVLDNPRFETWNTTSWSHLLLTISGINGDTAHKIGLKVGWQFYNWFLGRSYGLWQLLPCLYPLPLGFSWQLKADLRSAEKVYWDRLV